jgi:hypothetical protein
MPTFVYRNGKLVDKNRAPPKGYSNAKLLGVISDIMPETKHMADGQVYTSKAKFREATRAAGCIEVGNETATLLKPRAPVTLDRGQRRDAIKKAIYELRNR